MHPSAMLYYEMTNKFLEKEGATPSETAENRLKLNQMNGLLSSDEADLKANDATVGTEEGMTLASSIVPFALTSKGAVSKRSKAISPEDMQTVIDYAFYSAAKTANKILAGDFDCEPTKLGNVDACQYCNYKSICHFDGQTEGYKEKKIDKLGDNDEILQLMRDTMSQLTKEGDEGSGAN